MAPTRALLRFTLASGSSPLVARHHDDLIATPLGRWMLERVASTMLDWPTVAFHRVALTTGGLELVLIAGDHAVARSQFEALAAALGRELDVAARRGRWVRGPCWSAVEVALETAPSRPPNRSSVG